MAYGRYTVLASNRPGFRDLTNSKPVACMYLGGILTLSKVYTSANVLFAQGIWNAVY